MAFVNERWSLVGATAAADLSAHQYKFMLMSSTGVNINTVSGGVVVGVLTNKPTALGRAATVAISPSVTKVIVGSSTVAKGAKVKSDASGLADTAGAGTFAAGIALEGGASGEYITVQLMPLGLQ